MWLGALVRAALDVGADAGMRLAARRWVATPALTKELADAVQRWGGGPGGWGAVGGCGGSGNGTGDGVGSGDAAAACAGFPCTDDEEEMMLLSSDDDDDDHEQMADSEEAAVPRGSRSAGEAMSGGKRRVGAARSPASGEGAARKRARPPSGNERRGSDVRLSDAWAAVHPGNSHHPSGS